MLFPGRLGTRVISGFEKIAFRQLAGQKTPDLRRPVIGFLSLAAFQIRRQFLGRSFFFSQPRPDQPDAEIGVVLVVGAEFAGLAEIRQRVGESVCIVIYNALAVIVRASLKNGRLGQALVMEDTGVIVGAP